MECLSSRADKVRFLKNVIKVRYCKLTAIKNIFAFVDEVIWRVDDGQDGHLCGDGDGERAFLKRQQGAEVFVPGPLGEKEYFSLESPTTCISLTTSSIIFIIAVLAPDTKGRTEPVRFVWYIITRHP